MKRTSIALLAAALLSFAQNDAEAAVFAREVTPPSDGSVLVLYPPETGMVPATYRAHAPRYHGQNRHHKMHRMRHRGHRKHRAAAEVPAQPVIFINVLTDPQRCRTGLFGRVVNRPCRLR